MIWIVVWHKLIYDKYHHRYWGAMAPHFFANQKEKRETNRKKDFSKQKLLKGCHQGENVSVLAFLERLEFKIFPFQIFIFIFFSWLADNTCHRSMAPPLWNPFRWPCFNSLTTNIGSILKSVSQFAMSISWLVSIWWEHEH